MNKETAKEIMEVALEKMSDTQIRNLMEHAANKTPMIISRVRTVWADNKRGRY